MPRPKCTNLIGNKSVYKKKITSNEVMEEFKNKFVHTSILIKKEGMNYYETFFPFLKINIYSNHYLYSYKYEWEHLPNRC